MAAIIVGLIAAAALFLAARQLYKDNPRAEGTVQGVPPEPADAAAM